MKFLKIVSIFGILTFSVGCTVLNALDLSTFQDFLRGGNNKTQPRPQRTFTNLAPGSDPSSQSYSTLQTDADASYKQNRLVTLGSDQNSRNDGFNLPPDTRFPEALRPLLTERKYPKQGIALSGNSGAMLVPSPGVLEPGRSSVSVHAIPFDLYSINEVKYIDENYYDTSVKLVYGAMEGFEIGFDKTFANQDRFDINEPLYVNAKYQVPGNVTLGMNFCTSSQRGYHSAWVGAGVPVAWAAVGLNFGSSDYRFSYTGWDNLKYAKYGGYNYDYNKAKGYADPVFFLVGGAVPMNSVTDFVYDFNGDRFSLGFRFNFQRTAYLDVAYIADGDYERLPGAIAHKRQGNIMFGGSIVY